MGSLSELLTVRLQTVGDLRPDYRACDATRLVQQDLRAQMLTLNRAMTLIR